MTASIYTHTPEGLNLHTLERAGCPLHYWIGGAPDRPTVLLLHGATMDHRMFNAQIPALLADNYQVIVPDQRGHGRSQPVGAGFSFAVCVDDITAILDAENVKQVIVIGQSLGSMIGQRFIFDHPDRVLAFVSIGAVPIHMPYPRWEIAALRLSMPMLRWWPYQNLVKIVPPAIAQDPTVQAYALDALQQIDRTTFLAIWQGVAESISVTGLPGQHITVPSLLTHGENDSTGTVRQNAPRWAAYDPDVEYVIIPAAAHNANQDNAPHFNRSLRQFLRRVV